MNVLHIDSGILGDHSVSRRLTAAVAAQIKAEQSGATVTYRDLVAASKGIVKADIRVAQAPSDKITKDIEAMLRDLAKAEVSANLTVDPSLIGGLVVKMGSRMVDASVRTKLNSIRLAMKEAR